MIEVSQSLWSVPDQDFTHLQFKILRGVVNLNNLPNVAEIMADRVLNGHNPCNHIMANVQLLVVRVGDDKFVCVSNILEVQIF